VLFVEGYSALIPYRMYSIDQLGMIEFSFLNDSSQSSRLFPAVARNRHLQYKYQVVFLYRTDRPYVVDKKTRNELLRFIRARHENEEQTSSFFVSEWSLRSDLGFLPSRRRLPQNRKLYYKSTCTLLFVLSRNFLSQVEVFSKHLPPRGRIRTTFFLKPRSSGQNVVR
jgi:hypothetical protein